jgi:putative sigma-54 modulation protein
MMQLRISGNNYELTEKIKEYAQKKIGNLDKYLPKNDKDAAASVTLTMDPSGREDNQCVCEAHIKSGGADFEAKEATMNMFAAIDIVEAKLKSQILKHKEKTSPKSSQRSRWLNKLFRQ